jgi:hypothetical protein
VAGKERGHNDPGKRKRGRRVLAIFGVFLLLALVTIFVARVDLINHGSEFVLPEYGLQVSIEALDVSPFRRATSIRGLRIRYQDEYELQIAQLDINGLAYPQESVVAVDTVFISDPRVFQLVEGKQQELLLVDKISLAEISYHLDKKLDLGSLELDGIKFNQLQGEAHQPLLSADKLGLQSLTFQLNDSLGIARIHVDNPVVFEMISQASQQLFAAGQIDVNSFEYQLSGHFSLELLRVNEALVSLADLQRQLKWNALAVEVVQGDTDVQDISVSQLGLEKLIFIQAEEKLLDKLKAPLIDLPQIRVSQITLKHKTELLVDNVELAGGEVLLHRDLNGQISLLPAEPHAQTEEAMVTDSESQSQSQSENNNSGAQGEKAEKTKVDSKQVAATQEQGAVKARQQVSAEEPAEPFQFHLKKIFLSAPLRIDFKDESVEPAVKVPVKLEKLELNTLHNHAQGEDSDIVFAGKLGEDAMLQGDARFMLETLSNEVDLNAKITAFELPELTGYSQLHTGYALESGQLGFAVKMKVLDRKLNGEATVDFQGLSMIPANEAVIEQMGQQLSMPLPTALYLLEDSDGRIHLDVPVSGDMDNPSFSWNSIFRILTLRALKEASIYYVKTALFPGNLLVDAASMFGGHVYGKLMELPPMLFPLRQVELQSEHNEELDNLAALLSKKAKLSVKVCSYSLSADAPQDSADEDRKKAALSVAKQRALNIRKYLLDKGVRPTSLLTCLPKVDDKAEVPYVKLIM